MFSVFLNICVRRSCTLYSICAWLVWGGLLLASLGFLASINLRDAQLAFQQEAAMQSSLLRERFARCDMALAGFSALFSSVGKTEPERVSQYVATVLKDAPMVFAMEIVQRVDASELPVFSASIKKATGRDFTIKSFDYGDNRRWASVPPKKTYFPITFMAPMTEQSKEIIGLDMDSVPFLRESLLRAFQQGSAVATPAFRLVEGNLAYVVFSPLAALGEGAAGLNQGIGQQTQSMAVDMVIDIGRLVDVFKTAPVGVVEVLSLADHSPNDGAGILMKSDGGEMGWLEQILFPAFRYEEVISGGGGRFLFSKTRQTGWRDFDGGLVFVLAFVAAVTGLMIRALLKARRIGRLLQEENRQRLWDLANHDHLTGLPNRLLLMDRMEQSLSRLQRSNGKAAVLFLDVNRFKQVNDAHGHAVGDALLKKVSETLAGAVRSEDTVARLGGDEFIVLLEAVEGLDGALAVKQKIQALFEGGVAVDQLRLDVGISAGVAIFPDDSRHPEDLIRLADSRMYLEKASMRESDACPSSVAFVVESA